MSDPSGSITLICPKCKHHESLWIFKEYVCNQQDPKYPQVGFFKAWVECRLCGCKFTAKGGLRDIVTREEDFQ